MAAAFRQRPFELGVESGTMEEPVDPDVLFFHFVEQVSRDHPEATPVGSTASVANEVLRFRANPTFAFPPGEIAAVKPHAALPGVLDVTVNLIGLYGPSSPLPTVFTERVLDQDTGGAVADFLDLFNHRLTGLLFQIWKHYRHDLRYETGASDPLSLAAGTLMGLLPLPGGALEGARSALLPYTGLLAMASRSADTVSRVLGHYLGLDCRVEEFVLRRIAIPSDLCCRLGGPRELGVDSVIGESVQDIAGHCRIWAGPMPFARYLEFLPDGRSYAGLQDAIEFVVNGPLSRDLGLIIHAGEASGWGLGTGKLGWTTWLVPSRTDHVSALIN
jgi:type VI secretion system protein ImpH